MLYGDEKIAMILNAHKRGVSGDLESGLFIKEDLFHFKRRMLCSDKISMMIPLRFVTPEKDYLELNYKNEVPDNVFCYKNRDMLLEVKEIHDALQETTIEQEIELVKQSIKKINSGIVIYQKEELQVEKIQIGILDYKITLFNNSIYQMLILIHKDNCRYQLTFSCNIHDAETWRQVLKMMIETIHSEDDI